MALPPDPTSELVRLARGCWMPAEAADDLAARCMFLLDVCNGDALISDVTAAQLHGLWLPPGEQELHVTTARPERASRHMTRPRLTTVVAHRRQLSPPDRSTIAGVPVTSVARTWVDLAARLQLADLVAAGDSALRRGVTIEELTDVLRRSPRLRGVRRAREALPLLDAGSDSRPESHLRVALCAPDLPRFAANRSVHRQEGGWLARPDLSLEDARIALEYQGADHAEVARMRRDMTRSADLRAEGWECLLYGPAEVFGRPHAVRSEVRGLIRKRAPHLLRTPRRRAAA